MAALSDDQEDSTPPPPHSSVDREWGPLPSAPGDKFSTSQAAKYTSLSEEIACVRRAFAFHTEALLLIKSLKNYLLPALPYPRTRVPSFTIGRLRVTLQRLYLAVMHVHKPFFEGLMKLATWESHETSLFYCIVSPFTAESFRGSNS